MALDQKLLLATLIMNVNEACCKACFDVSEHAAASIVLVSKNVKGADHTLFTHRFLVEVRRIHSF